LSCGPLTVNCELSTLEGEDVLKKVENIVIDTTYVNKSIGRELRVIIQALPFILPGFILVCVFVLYPMIKNIQISLSDYKIVEGTMDFVGFKNYKELFSEPQGRFWYAYRNNVLYALFTTPAILFLGLVCAVMINSLKKGIVFFRTMYYLPVITSWIIVGLVFKYLFNESNRGMVNYLLVDVFHVMPHYISWLKEEWTGNFVIWLLGIWKNIGWAMVIYLAGLQSIPNDLYVAASIEGANEVQKFFKITIPLLKSTTFFLTVQLLIGSFNVFLQVLVLTGGDPMGKTSVLQYLLYDRSFRLFQFGQGAAIGIVTAVSIFVVTVVLNRILKSEQY
jgi:multiple sugar transport system permease protein